MIHAYISKKGILQYLGKTHGLKHSTVNLEGENGTVSIHFSFHDPSKDILIVKDKQRMIEFVKSTLRRHEYIDLILNTRLHRLAFRQFMRENNILAIPAEVLFWKKS